MKKYLIILALVTLGISGAARANLEECKFYAGADSVQIMSPGAQPVITPLPVGTVTTPVQISNTIVMETTPALKSHCDGGNDGENTYQMTNNAMVVGYIDNKALFSTNIPGIYYTLAMYPDGNGVTAWFPPNANSWYMTAPNDDHEEQLNEKTWHARMDIYQTNGFVGVPADVNFLTASAGPIGQIILGDPNEPSTSDHPRPYVNMSEMSFSIPLNRPTCVLRAPVTVDLGDWYPAEVENGNTSTVEFHITGTCVNTTAVYYTLSSTHTTADKNYFTNAIQSTSGVTAAGGVGVMVLDSPSSNYPVPADSFNRVIAIGDIVGDPVYVVDKALGARLVKTGSDPITVGAFGTTITFQATYE